MKIENMNSKYTRAYCDQSVSHLNIIIRDCEKRIKEGGVTNAQKNELESQIESYKKDIFFFKSKKTDLLKNEKENRLVYLKNGLAEGKKLLEDKELDSSLKLIGNIPPSPYELFLKELSSKVKNSSDKKKPVSLLEKEIINREVKKRDGTVTVKKVTKYIFKKEDEKKMELKDSGNIFKLG